jgi:RimJ/RimL family protein N-acetyltransferase
MKFRLATIEDAEDLLRWKNQKDARQFSIAHHRRILKKDHLKWLEKTLQEGKMKIWILEGVGNVRIINNEIAIGIDELEYGKGWATKMIKFFSKPGMTAKIVDGNVASMRVFYKCGFKPFAHACENGIGYYILRCE